jgi:uncharacterized integral membrane protein
MARRSQSHADDLRRVHRTRAGRVWLAIAPALVFLVLLIVFIAENGQHVKVSFFGASGHPPLAIALLIAAVAGAVVVLLAGSVRILQLRRATQRHLRGPGRSAAPAGNEPEAVQPKQDTDPTRP